MSKKREHGLGAITYECGCQDRGTYWAVCKMHKKILKTEQNRVF